MIASPEQVLEFWLGPPALDEEELGDRVRRWFAGGPEMDREVTARFAATLEAALRDELDGWAATPRGRLALVIVLDQFSRNICRDQPRMYSRDGKAQQLAREAFERELDRGLDYPWCFTSLWPRSLGRTSTEAERAFLEDWESKAPPRGMRAGR